VWRLTPENVVGWLLGIVGTRQELLRRFFGVLLSQTVTVNSYLVLLEPLLPRDNPTWQRLVFSIGWPQGMMPGDVVHWVSFHCAGGFHT
jgi:hypothetical protein